MNKNEVYTLIEQHYRDNFNRLVKFLANKTGSYHNAEEVVQNAYLRACEYWPSFNITGEFGKWFSMILANSLKDKLSEEKTHGMVDDHSSLLTEEPKAINKLILNQVVNHISIQPEPMKTIYTLHFLMQYHSKDIAKLVPQKANYIDKLVSLFRKELKTLFQVGTVRKIYQ